MILRFILLATLLCGDAFAQPTWFGKAPPLSAPAGAIERASTPEQIVLLAEKLAPGRTLMIEPGTYKLPRPIVLNERTNITIRGASGDPRSVTLIGKGWVDGDDHDDLIHVSHSDSVLIAGLTFAECRSYGIKVEAERGPRNVHIFNCNFRNIGIRAIKGSAGQDPSVRAVRGSVRFCDFENTQVPPADWLFGGDYISAIDMMALENWTFSDNSFKNIKGRNGGGRAAIFLWVRSTNVVVERNFILNCDRGIALGNPGQSTANRVGEDLAYVSEGIIRNNFIAGGADCGIELWHVRGIKVWHNSIWRPEQNWGRGIRIGTGTRDTEVINNLVHGAIQQEGGAASVSHNLAARLDGYFVDPETGNLELTGAAPDALGRGVPLGAVPRDIRLGRRKLRPDLGAWEAGAEREEWIDEMRKVHGHFRGTPGTFVQLGDSITFSGAFWSPLRSEPSNLNSAAREAYWAVHAYMKAECFEQKGPSFGNKGSMTVLWARENIRRWLKELNPEAAVVMFGSNDVRSLELEEYERVMREVVQACLENGTVVMLTTAPPQSDRLEKCLAFAAAIRRIAADFKVPLIDYSAEILRRRPSDWDGSAAQFKAAPGDTYNVPTLISRDGVHPSNPSGTLNDFSEDVLNRNGYALRNYLTLLSYADVIRNVLWP